MKKLILGIGTLAVIATPVVAVISCGSSTTSNVKTYELKEEAKGITLTVDNNLVTKIEINTFLIKSLSQLKTAFNSFIWCIDAGKEWPDNRPTDDTDVVSDEGDTTQTTEVEVDENGNPIITEPEEVPIKTWSYEYDQAQVDRIFGKGVDATNFTFGEGTTINLYELISMRGPKADEIINDYFLGLNSEYPVFEDTGFVITPERAKARVDEAEQALIRARRQAELSAIALEKARNDLSASQDVVSKLTVDFTDAEKAKTDAEAKLAGAEADQSDKQTIYDNNLKIINDEKDTVLGGKSLSEVNTELATARAEVERLEGVLGRSYTIDQIDAEITAAPTGPNAADLTSLKTALLSVIDLQEKLDKVTILSSSSQRIQTWIDNYLTLAERTDIQAELASNRMISGFDVSRVSDQTYMENFVIGGYMLASGTVIPEGVTLKGWELYTTDHTAHNYEDQIAACTAASLPKPTGTQQHSVAWMKQNIFTASGVSYAKDKVATLEGKMSSQLSVTIDPAQMLLYKNQVIAKEEAEVELNKSNAVVEAANEELDTKTEEYNDAKDALDAAKVEFDKLQIVEINATDENAKAEEAIIKCQEELEKSQEYLANVLQVNVPFPPESGRQEMEVAKHTSPYRLGGIHSGSVIVNLTDDFEFSSFSTSIFDSGASTTSAINDVRRAVIAHMNGIDVNDPVAFNDALLKVMNNPNINIQFLPGETEVNPDYLIPSLFGPSASNNPPHAKEIAEAIVGVFINMEDGSVISYTDITELLDDETRSRVEDSRELDALKALTATAYNAAFKDATAKPLLIAVTTAYNNVKLDRTAFGLFTAYVAALDSGDTDLITSTKAALVANPLGKALNDAIVAGEANPLVKAWIDAKIAEVNHQHN